MAATPKYKVYDNDGVYQAACKVADDAAVLVTIAYGDRGTVRLGHGKILFTAGVDVIGDDSYDAVTEIIVRREAEVNRVAFAKAYTR